MPRYFIEVSYKGTNYSGFQIQQNAITIQSEVENALTICLRKTFALTGASRTDAGVHAIQNFFHFDSEEQLFFDAAIGEKKNKTLHQVMYSLNSILPGDIVIKNIKTVDSKVHCRFDAVSREYKYCIYRKKNAFLHNYAFFYPYPVDLKKLQEAANIIITTTDFTSFSKRKTQVQNFICSVYKSEWKYERGQLIYNVIANRFLRGMVRGLVGTMVDVGSSKISLIQFKEIIQKKDASKVNFSAPACGLFLVNIKY